MQVNSVCVGRMGSLIVFLTFWPLSKWQTEDQPVVEVALVVEGVVAAVGEGDEGGGGGNQKIKRWVKLIYDFV